MKFLEALSRYGILPGVTQTSRTACPGWPDEFVYEGVPDAKRGTAADAGRTAMEPDSKRDPVLPPAGCGCC